MGVHCHCHASVCKLCCIALYWSSANLCASALVRHETSNHVIDIVTLLLFADMQSVALRRCMDAIKWILEQGVAITACEAVSGFCVLHAACKGGQADMLLALLQWPAPSAEGGSTAQMLTAMHTPLEGNESCRRVPPAICCVQHMA